MCKMAGYTEALVLSHCDINDMEIVTKILKTGEKIQVHNRSNSIGRLWEEYIWLIKLFIFIHSELNPQKILLKNILVSLSDALVTQGLEKTTVRRSNHRGCQSVEELRSQQLPIECNSRRRCVNCAKA